MKNFGKIKDSVGLDRTAKQAASYILKVQSGVADHLNKRARNVSERILLLALFLFSAAFGGYCLYLILTPFINH